MRWFLAPLLALLTALPPARAEPAADPWTACRLAIAAAERGSGVPEGLLLAIALVESGRPAPGGGVTPWPFAINAEGSGRFPPDRAAAIAAVEALRATGLRSMDVGCMQVNLLHHPEAFPDLDAAFDPARNVAYAVGFLRDLFAASGSWSVAVAQYHSRDPERGLAYHARVRMARAANLVPRAVAGLCDRGRRATTVAMPGGRTRIVCRLPGPRATAGVDGPPAPR